MRKIGTEGRKITGYFLQGINGTSLEISRGIISLLSLFLERKSCNGSPVPPPLKGVIYGCKIFPVPSNFQQTLLSESPLSVKDLAHSQDLRFGYLLAAINCYVKPLEKKKNGPVSGSLRYKRPFRPVGDFSLSCCRLRLQSPCRNSQLHIYWIKGRGQPEG